MTPDELPADMEAVVARLEVSAIDPVPWPDLRALLKAYQEQRRALGEAIRAFDEMDAATCGAASLDQFCSHYGMKSAQRIVHARMQIDLARAALNQKGDER